MLGSQRGGAVNDVCVLQCGMAGVWCEARGSLLLQQQQGVGALVQHSSRHIQRHLRPNLGPVPSQAEVVDPGHSLKAEITLVFTYGSVTGNAQQHCLLCGGQSVSVIEQETLLLEPHLVPAIQPEESVPWV